MPPYHERSSAWRWTLLEEAYKKLEEDVKPPMKEASRESVGDECER